MKQKIALGLAIVMAITLFAFDSTATNSIPIFINGKSITTATPPIIVNNSVMVPIRVISETFGADVKWLPQTNTVSITYQSESQLKLMKLNGEPTTWPYWYENGIVYMEYRNVIEMLRIKYPPAWHNVSYLPESKQLMIGKKFYDVNTMTKDGFTVVSLKSLQDRQAISYDWNPDTGNLTLK